jgi:hypothetical protein
MQLLLCALKAKEGDDRSCCALQTVRCAESRDPADSAANATRPTRTVQRLRWAAYSDKLKALLEAHEKTHPALKKLRKGARAAQPIPASTGAPAAVALKNKRKRFPTAAAAAASTSSKQQKKAVKLEATAATATATAAESACSSGAEELPGLRHSDEFGFDSDYDDKCSSSITTTRSFFPAGEHWVSTVLFSMRVLS